MKTESLQALIIDRDLGELSPQAAEMLEHYLTTHPEARVAEAQVIDALGVTREALLNHPELVRANAPIGRETEGRRWPSFSSTMAKAAAVVLLAGLAGAGGFLAGRSAPQSGPVLVKSASPSPRPDSPWTSYRVAFQPNGGGLQVVPVKVEKL